MFCLDFPARQSIDLAGQAGAPLFVKKKWNKISLKLYPNPTEGTITVEYEVREDEITTFELIDLLGKKQFSSRLSVGNSHQLNLTPMQSGLYIYRLKENDQIVKSDKLIIQQ